jgi:hypothetical protein
MDCGRAASQAKRKQSATEYREKFPQMSKDAGFTVERVATTVFTRTSRTLLGIFLAAVGGVPLEALRA